MSRVWYVSNCPHPISIPPRSNNANTYLTHLWHTKLPREIDSLKWKPECYAICLSHIPVYKVHCRWTVSGMPRQTLCPMLFSNRWRSTCNIYYTIFVVYWDISENLLSKYYRNQCFTLFPKLDYTLFQWMVATFCNCCVATLCWYHTQIAKFMGPTWGPPESWRPQMGPCWPHEQPCYQGTYCCALAPSWCQTVSNCHVHWIPVITMVSQWAW